MYRIQSTRLSFQVGWPWDRENRVVLLHDSIELLGFVRTPSNQKRIGPPPKTVYLGKSPKKDSSAKEGVVKL